MPRVVDLSLIVSGAVAPVAAGIGGEAEMPIDSMPVAFAAAFSLSVFPAFGLYVPIRECSTAGLMSRTVVAWGVVQGCCAALLYSMNYDRSLSATWFAYWTLTTCFGLLAFRAGGRVAFDAVPRAGAYVHPAPRADIAPGARGAVKRAFDLLLAPCLIALLSPLLAAVALAVKRDGGPCLYAHIRVGLGGRPFRCLKFRTMATDADRRLQSLLETNPHARAEWEREFKLKSDVRVTPVGRVLRRTSLDELPQLINVIRGEMSLVGPRPIVEAELPRYGADVAYYLAVRPGMTGLWQVSGRNDTSYAARVSLDVRYVRTWSLGRDLRILFKTIGVVARGAGAY
ncbi:UDP-phosphate galactose phosphotransferase [Burkholderia stagnalis]|nr:UDP-phosphate galactose phosphotransferase [Burkholderia stagnalis]KVO52817.1 UDP-phosphate galactose phosphotransferase [Burkholderia stagnalis]KVP06890.1 UDP-phosphate galactose phosphotransferase [Burkholderia stagnalis]KVW97685.1 UDP-phosphate galactose phosphotransferase [Burkholderia stagnalis]KWH83352.1 UDP-phosphate galactose phosphotransferase [Burkholderia stagnalis]